MKSLKSTIYDKLLLQAEEAKEQDMKKLATGIMSALPASPDDEIKAYSHEELKDNIYNQLWKIAADVIGYYDLTSVDAEKVGEALDLTSNTVFTMLCASLNIDPNSIGPNEPKLPGEDK